MTTLRRVILESKKNNKVHISTNYSSSEESDSENEVSPRTRRKIELLEQQTKNIKPPAVESPVKKSKDYTICAVCETGGKLLKCTGLCNRSFHETCIEFRLSDDSEGIICFDCLRKKNMCNYCKTEGSTVQTRKKCLKKCTICKDKFYCQNCIENEKSFESIFPVVCPLHHCSQCGYPGKSKSNYLLQCVRCTNAFHSKCLPVNIQRINDKYIVCPVHLPTKSNTTTTTPKSSSSSKKSMSSIQIRENGVLTSEKHKKHKYSDYNNFTSSSSNSYSRYNDNDNNNDDEEEDTPLPLLHRNSLSTTTTPTSVPYKFINKQINRKSPLYSSNIEIKKDKYDDDDEDDDYQYEDDDEEYEKKKSIKRKSESKSYSSDNDSKKSPKRKKTSSNTVTPTAIKTPKSTPIATIKLKSPKSKPVTPVTYSSKTVTPNMTATTIRTTPKATINNTSAMNNNHQSPPKIELKLTSSKVITMIDSPLTIATQTERPLLSLSTSFTSLIYGTIIHPSNNKNVVDIKTETFMCNKILSFLENKPLNVNKLYVGLKNEGCTEEQLVMKAPNFETTGNYILSNPNLKFYCGPMKSIKPWKVTSS